MLRDTAPAAPVAALPSAPALPPPGGPRSTMAPLPREGATPRLPPPLSPTAERVLAGAEALREGQWARCISIHRPYQGE